MMTKRFIQREQADSVRANLKVISDEFDAISNGLFADRLSLSPAHSDLLFSAPFPVQKLIDSDVITEKVTLWDTTRLIVSSTRSISNTERISDYDRHAFFLLQNYKSPILPGLNESTFQYEAAGQLIVSKLSRVIIIVSSVSLAMLSLFAILVIRPNICQVEQDSTNLLIRVLQVSSKVMLERRKKAMTRLVLLGEAESDAVYTNTDKVIQADEVKTHSKNVRNVIKKLRRVSIQQRVMITVKIIIPLLLLSAYYLLFCLIDYGAIKSNLSHSSSLINWTSYEQMAVRLVLLDEYNLIVLNNASIPSAEVNTAINELQRVHHSLIYGDQKGSTLNLIRNPSFPGQDKVLFRSACNGGGNCSSKFHGLLMNGLHVMILDYLRRSQQIVFNQSLVNRRSQFAELFDLESPSLQEIITGGITSLISNISDNIAQNHDAIGLVLLLIFILILAVMYRLIYAPLIANMAIREKHIDIISNLLPS